MLEAKLQEEINKLPVIQKAHIWEPSIDGVAEISFKAGVESEKAHRSKQLEQQVHDAHEGGIRKVVEWINNRSVSELEPHYIWWISKEKWQAQLKEWGIK